MARHSLVPEVVRRPGISGRGHRTFPRGALLFAFADNFVVWGIVALALFCYVVEIDLILAARDAEWKRRAGTWLTVLPILISALPLLGLLGTVAAGELRDDARQLFVAQSFADGRPPRHHVPRIVRQDLRPATGGDWRQPRHLRRDHPGQEEQPIAHQRLAAQFSGLGQVQVQAELFPGCRHGNYHRRAGSGGRGEGGRGSRRAGLPEVGRRKSEVGDRNGT